MISQETIKRIANLTGLKLFQQEKNYIQTLILRSIYSKISRELVFKGCTALAFFMVLIDLAIEFTLAGTLDLNDLVKEIEKDFEALGIRATENLGG